METKDLSVLLKAIELGSLTKASTELGYSPSAASHIIERLEEQLGITLLERSHTGVGPTKNCELLLPSIRSILEQQELIQSLAVKLSSSMSGQLNVGSISSVAVSWLPDIFDSFLNQFPWLNITTLEGSYPEVERWLQEGKVDCAFASAGIHGSFTFLPLRSDPFCIVFPKGHPLSQKESIHLLELRGYNVFIQAEGLEYDAPSLIRMIPKSDTRITPVHLRDLTLLSLIRRGRGIAILPEMLIDHAGTQDIDSRPLSTGDKRTICLAYNNANGAVPGPVVQSFIDHVVSWATVVT